MDMNVSQALYLPYQWSFSHVDSNSVIFSLKFMYVFPFGSRNVFVL